MRDLFENLFITSPNGGGLFFVSNGEIHQLDRKESTGIYFEDGLIVRGVQPDDLHIYSDRLVVVDGNELGFGDVHDVIIYRGYCYIVATEQNDILKFGIDGKLRERWRFSEKPDSWHINCVAEWNGRIVFSAFGKFDEHREYKGQTAGRGFVQDLMSGRVLIDKLSQPHSIVASGSRLILANSEEGEVIEFDEDGQKVKVCKLDGYTRGIAIVDQIVYVGISRSRNVETTDIDTASIVALDGKSFEEIKRLDIPANEIYAVSARPKLQHTIQSLAILLKNSNSKTDL